ncbi:putative ATP-dependent DNA helicase HFM1-like [Hibiscus syriacus]|uniref:ATP-dependent DNA helicase HFM1-like n=1 Tax=Hibiscus syriacus TaxID=106335 RepID=A0A6A2Y106_HIBSY|nr:putative ATP-dependent DNA helicase HFM1-like [Hibiscus syriacus]
MVTAGTVLHCHLLKIGVFLDRFIAIKLLILYLESRKSSEANQIVNEFNGFDLVVQNCLINSAIQWGDLSEARKLFDEMPERNEITWTLLISGLMKCGKVKESMLYFERNPFKSVVSWTAGITGKVFDQMETRDVVSWTAILDVYFEMGNLGEARRIFDEMPKRNEVSWSAIIARCNQYGDNIEALKLFRQMVREGIKPTISCLSSVLCALASLESLQAGKSIHAHVLKIGIEEDIFISCTLVDLYSKYLFDNMPNRNNISWGALIGGYVEFKQFDMVFEVFNEMILSGETPTKLTFSSVLCTCASVASLEKGKDIHGKILKSGFQYDVYFGTALTDMYAKCGDIESSKQVFNRMSERNEFSWTVMIQGLAESGFAKESLSLFEEMKRNSSVAPYELMFLSVLFACSHCGLVNKGLKYFGAMESVYGIRPKRRHYTCVVDMLARSGRLYEAEELINSMPFQPEANALAALLSGCKTYKNEEIAERTERKLVEVVEKNSAGFVLLSNIYASTERWNDVSNIRKLMRQKGLKKSVGYSWVEIRSHVHCFYSGDGTHLKSAEINDILELLRSEMIIS